MTGLSREITQKRLHKRKILSCANSRKEKKASEHLEKAFLMGYTVTTF